MNYYPEQLQAIARLCFALNGAQHENDGEQLGQVSLGQHLPVETEDGEVIGHLIDEIGGAWSFVPLAEKASKA